jgi:hypothetical protein
MIRCTLELVNVNDNRNWHLTGLKYCYGPLHDIEGELLPCDPSDPDKSAFVFLTNGPRTGKPKSRCKRCSEAHKSGLGDQDAQLAKMRPVDMTPPDAQWWHNTGMEWLPRYGEEMLGEDF